MNLAISIATYQRKDGSTPKYLTRALESIKNQTYQNFKVFLIGDRYDNDNEFTDLATSILKSEQIYFENRSVAPERDLYAAGSKELWCSGGVAAYNYAIDCALTQGYDYVCHLDHDDYWDIHHLEFINQVIEHDPNSGLVFSCAKHFNGMILPRGVPSDSIVYQRRPIPADTVHSSVCVNHRLIPLKYRDVFAAEGRVLEADMDMWSRVWEYLNENPGIASYLINAVTCFHDIESH